MGSLGVSPGRFAERSGSLGVSPGRFAERSGSLGVSPGRFAERSGPLGVSPSRFAERSLRHPGFAHSCILAFALRAALDCKAGSFGPGSPLAYGFKGGLSAAFGGGLRPGGAGGRAAGRVFGCRRRIERDGSSGAGGTSAKPRPLCGPRTRPACVCIRFAARGPVPFLSLTKKWRLGGSANARGAFGPILVLRRDFCRLPSRTTRSLHRDRRRQESSF